MVTCLLKLRTTSRQCAYMAQDGPKAPRWAKMAPRWPKRAQVGPKMGPRCPQDGPIWPQDGPRWPKMGPRWPQNRSKRVSWTIQEGITSKTKSNCQTKPKNARTTSTLGWGDFETLKRTNSPPKSSQNNDRNLMRKRRGTGATFWAARRNARASWNH